MEDVGPSFLSKSILLRKHHPSSIILPVFNSCLGEHCEAEGVGVLRLAMWSWGGAGASDVPVLLEDIYFSLPTYPQEDPSIPLLSVPIAPFPGTLHFSWWVGAWHLLDQVHLYSQEQNPCIGQAMCLCSSWLPFSWLVYTHGVVYTCLVSLESLCAQTQDASAWSTAICILSLPVIGGLWPRTFPGLLAGRGSGGVKVPRMVHSAV